MMITAQEANSKYNSLKLKAEQYIKETIEPMIRQVYQSEKSITVDVEDMWYVGHKIRGLDEGNTNGITEQVEQILKENGYTLTTTLETTGDEYRHGYGKMIISWEDVT